MSIIKKLLSPIYVAIFVVTLIASIVAHLYVGHCQTTKWHYMLQRYYCPSWYKPDLEFKNRGYKRWRVWNKDGQLISSLNINEIGDVDFKSWYENGQKETNFSGKKNDASRLISENEFGSVCNFVSAVTVGFDDSKTKLELWYKGGNSKLTASVNFKGDTTYKLLYENGRVQGMVVFSDNIKNGYLKEWGESGQLYASSSYNKEYNLSESYIWRENGVVSSYSCLHEDWILTASYYENGAIESIYESSANVSKYDQSYSISREWFQNGQMKRHVIEKLAVSQMQEWYSNGQIQRTWSTKQGEMIVSSSKNNSLDNSEIVGLLGRYFSPENFTSYLSSERESSGGIDNVNFTSYVIYLMLINGTTDWSRWNQLVEGSARNNVRFLISKRSFYGEDSFYTLRILFALIAIFKCLIFPAILSYERIILFNTP